MKRDVAALARAIASKAGGKAATVACYSDNVGSAVVSMAQSLARAKSVAALLRVDLRAIGVGHASILVQGFGATNFVASNSSERGRAQNRRVTVLY
jgi:outer membrane protein OmpA-like peptidoglycan-associated protein